MRELVLAGAVALLFGLGSYYAVGELGVFSGVNLGAGALALAAALGLSVLRSGLVREPATRGPVLDVLLGSIAILWALVLVERAAALSGVRFDWTFERRFELSPATRAACDAVEGALTATLYHEEFDPRTRRTRLLLEELGEGCALSVQEKLLGDAPKEEDRYGIASSNTIVFQADGHWQRVDRPTEGAIFEALARLGAPSDHIAYVTVGTGEGDLERSGDTGYSGFAVALQTEGFRVRTLSTAFVSEVPLDADAVIVIAPQRALRPEAIEALRRYLERGGSLVAFLEPGVETGLEGLLADFGLRSPDALVVDPASGPVDGETPGLSPIAFSYSQHPVTKGLDSNRMTFFRRARTFDLHKPRPDDHLEAVVYASPQSWLEPDPVATGLPHPPEPPPSAEHTYHPLVVTGVFERGGAEARVVAFGDSDVASNRYLRAMYNLDLVMNAVDWVTRREPKITIRPKAGQVIQFPVPIQNSLKALYGVGLLVPELLLLGGGLVWLRRRRA